MKSRVSLSILIVAAFFFFILSLGKVSANAIDAQTDGTILYVKPGTDGDCLSWATACELQTAIFNAVSGDQIWVALGTYKPTTSSDREATFQLKSGVAIYGGFPPAGGEWVDRNWEINLTTLSGDIGIIGDIADNSYHVVTGSGVDSTAVLDGFTITRGNADGVFPDNYGGGMLNDSGSPTLSNLVYHSNSALFGGGLSNIYSSGPMMNNVIFMNNLATEYGGGMNNKYSSSPTATNLTFLKNSAKYGGGLVNNHNSSPTITESNFIENSATYSGGGIWNYNNSNLTLTDIIFTSNSAVNGGGIWNEESVLTLMQASFVSNSAAQGGGGIKFHFCRNGSVLQNVTFSSNSANYRGGGLLNHYSSPSLVNVTFTQNSSDLDGGGIFNEYISHPVMTNSILWENVPDQIVNDSKSFMSVTYSIVQRGYPGEGNLDINPLLGSLQNNGGFTETHALQAASPAVDAGNPDSLTCPETDQRTLPRPVDGNGDGITRCDMGAYELQPYILTTQSIGEGQIVVNPDQPDYALSQELTLTASANPGWTFSNWSGDATGTDNPLTYTIVGNTNIAANFTQDEYTLSVTSIGSGAVTIEPVQATYHYGDEVTLTPTANPGWTFSNWSGDASENDNPLTYTIVGDTNITANFTQDEYTLAVSIEPESKGSVVVDPLQATYHYGDEVTLTPTANQGWTFSNWSGDASGNDNPLTYTIVGDTNITANFTQDEYVLTITVEPADSGSVLVTPVKATYHYGDEVILTPTANAGWTFSNWNGNATGTEIPLVYTITGNTSITANFTQNEYTLTVGVNPTDSGTVSIDPVKTSYHYGDEVTLTPTANPGWTFSNWGGDASGPDNPLTYTITGNTNIIANFTQDEYTLSVISIGSGAVTIEPVQATYHYGDEVTLTPTANPGWTFSNWSSDASGNDNPLTYTIIGDTSITANFTQDEYVLTINVEPADSGSVSVTPVKDTYHYGDEVTLTAIPGTDWSFGSWSGDLNSLDNPFTFTISSNISLSANFNRIFRLFMPLITRN